MTLHDDLNQLGYELIERRARSAEDFARAVLAMTPFTRETAGEFAARIRRTAERSSPDLLLRFEHSRLEILPLAEDCGCDPDSDGYDDDHCESDMGGEYLCARQHLGWVCGTCEAPDDSGPEWRPDRFEWPCPAVRALDTAP